MNTQPANKLTEIPIDRLHPHPHNPRGSVELGSVVEMAESIREKGILEPLLIVPWQEMNGWMHYTIIAGHRRYTGAKSIGLTHVPVIIKHLDEREQEEVMLVENIQRENLSPLQEGKAFQRLIEKGATYNDIARRIGSNSPYVQSRLSLLKISPVAQELFDQNLLPITAAPVLQKFNPERQATLARRLANFQITVAQLKQIAHNSEALKKEKPAALASVKERAPHRDRQEFTRADGVKLIAEKTDHIWHNHNILSALDGICKKCGMAQHPVVCTGCPLPQFLHQLAGVTTV